MRVPLDHLHWSHMLRGSLYSLVPVLESMRLTVPGRASPLAMTSVLKNLS